MARTLADEPGLETWARSAALASGTRCNTQGDPAPCRALPVEGSSACGPSPRPSRCLVSARTRSDREPSTRNTVVSGPNEDLCPDERGRGPARRTFDSAPADRRDRSI